MSALDTSRAVCLTEEVLSDPSRTKFRGLIGRVVNVRVTDAGETIYAVYFPDRGATSVWESTEIRNIDEPPKEPA